MFCRNCGEVLIDTDVYCLNCGYAAGDGSKYCASCGSETLPGAMVCEICGNPVSDLNPGGGMQFQQAPPPYQQAPQYRQAPPPIFQQPPVYPDQFSDPVYRQSFDPNMMQNAGSYTPPNAYNIGANGQPYYQGYTYKSKVAAGVLGIIFGAFGVHNFYLGKNGQAVAQLLMTLCTCGVLGFISAVWGFVEGIMLLTGSIDKDGNGMPLK